MNVCYSPTDEMSLWWLGQPLKPLRVGDLFYVPGLRGVGLRYDPAWLSHGFALSEDLPLRDQDFLPLQKDSAVGAIDDARPDRWGERVIRLLDRPSRLSLMEYLYFAGDDRFGALGVSLRADVYEPRMGEALPRLSEIDSIEGGIREIMAGAPVDERFNRLVSPGASMGGARPKALISMDGAEWVLKFRESGEAIDAPLIEHATITLARACGIHVAETRAVSLQRGHAVAVRRFDRTASSRLHCLSAAVALRAIGEEASYPALAQLLRRKGPVGSGKAAADMRELFRRMVFNILIDNNDDHEKNHVLLMDDAGYYRLSPAFDVLPTGQALGFQQMRVGTDGAVSTLENALSEHEFFGLRREDAIHEVRHVCQAVEGWKQHFRSEGVAGEDLALLKNQIDRPFLAEQRHRWLADTN